jgi:hypothetical protein
MDKPKKRPWWHWLRVAEVALAVRELGWGGLLRAVSDTITRRRGAARVSPFRPCIEALETRLAPATYTWDGGGADNNWSTAGNWTSDTAPGASDTAVFDGTSTKAATIDVNVSVDGLQINSGYTNTITQSSGKTVTVGSGIGFSQGAGTFAGGDSAIDINGAFVLSGGTFTSTSGTMTLAGNFTVSNSPTFNANSGTVTFDGSVSATADVNSTFTFNNLTFNKDDGNNVTVSYGDTLIVTGTTTFTDGGMVGVSGSGVEARGNVTVASTFDGGSGVLVFGSTASQTFTLTSATDKYDGNITVNKSSGTVTLASALVMDSSGQTLTVTSGTLVPLPEMFAVLAA